MRRIDRVIWLCSLLWLALAGRALAEPEARANRVVLLAADLDRTEQTTFDATRALLLELNVDTLLRPIPAQAELRSVTQRARDAAESEHALAVVWLERRERAVLVYFYQRAQARLLTRRVEVSESEAAASEEVALIVRSAVAAALEGAEVAMTEVALPEAKPAPPPAPAPPPSVVAPPKSERARLSAGYAGTSLSADVPWQHGAGFGFTWLPSPTTRVGIGFVLTPAFDAANDAVGIRLHRFPLRLSWGWALRTGALELVPELSLGAELVRRNTLRTSSTLSPEAASSRWLTAVGGRARAQYRFVSRFDAYAALGVDLVLNPHDEVSVDASGSETVMTWAAVRPAAEAGVSVQIW